MQQKNKEIVTPVQNLSQKYIDISLPFTSDKSAASAWYVAPVEIEPVRAEGFIGSVAEGGPVNFRNITFNPHGNGTHTECVGHIDRTVHSINQCLKKFFFNALLISIKPEPAENGDFIISREQIIEAIGEHLPEALIIRTLPNNPAKKQQQYSGTNPPYLHPLAAAFIRDQKIDHLLIDLPSVDREEDEGQLLAHKEFWNYPNAIRWDATITEFIYVPDNVKDGEYWLNLQVAPFENDAAPSRPILYQK